MTSELSGVSGRCSWLDEDVTAGIPPHGCAAGWGIPYPVTSFAQNRVSLDVKIPVIIPPFLPKL